MKKSILAIAVAATMAAPAVMAAPTIYGNIHLSIMDLDSADNMTMSSNTSSIGVKGSEDLGDGLKAIYKAEFQLDATGSSENGNALTARDVFVGVKGGLGTVRVGAVSSNYKQMGGKVDSLYRTPAEGRGLIHTQSNLHGGRDINRGRMTNSLQYLSPKMSGVQLVANTTFSNSNDETMGLGLRYETKGILAYADWIDAQPGVAITGNVPSTDTESAFKVGGKFSTDLFHVALQYEAAGDLTGFDYIHANAGYNINANNSIQLTIGTATHEGIGNAVADGNRDTTGFSLAYVHSLSKMTMVYVAYADISDDVVLAADSKENSAFVLGIRKKF